MTTREPECVTLKRRGAEHIAQLLSGKSKREELEFWDKRTESLRSRLVYLCERIVKSKSGFISPSP